jgi:thiol-disulfide isomerase/thioredoxin
MGFINSKFAMPLRVVKAVKLPILLLTAGLYILGTSCSSQSADQASSQSEVPPFTSGDQPSPPPQPDTNSTTPSSQFVVSPYAASTSNSGRTSSKVALADHLSQVGASMYTTSWCTACKEQLALFGQEAANHLNLVECDVTAPDPQPNRCRAANVNLFPSWQVSDQILPGVRPLDQLADASGYQGSRDWDGVQGEPEGGPSEPSQSQTLQFSPNPGQSFGGRSDVSQPERP